MDCPHRTEEAEKYDTGGETDGNEANETKTTV